MYVLYRLGMKSTPQTYHPAAIGLAYAALRRGGASQARAGAELGIGGDQAVWLEGVFRREPAGRGMDAMRPRFARHDVHVAAVLAQGGFAAICR